MKNNMTLKNVATKLIVEIRFRPNLRYYDEMFKIASSIEGDYEEWQAKHNPSEAILIDNSRKTNLKVTSSSLTLVTENSDLFGHITEEINKLFVLFLEPAEIKVIRRIGVRKMGVYEVDEKYGDCVDKFYNAFYGAKDEIRDIAADAVDDVAFILDGVKDGYKNQVRVAPLKKEQVTPYYRPDFTDEPITNVETSLYIDVDVSTSVEDDYESASKNIAAVVESNEKIYSRFFELVKRDLNQ